MLPNHLWLKRVAVSLAALALLILVGGLTRAAKPGGNSVPPGRIFYWQNNVWSSMNADGSDKTAMPNSPTGQPTRVLHAGTRWLLQWQYIPDEFYPLHLSIPVASATTVKDDLESVDFVGLPPPIGGWRIFIKIDGAGAPDTFAFRRSNSSGWIAQNIPITGGEQDLDLFGNGLVVLTIQFGATTGHALGDRWEIGIIQQPRIELFAVRDDGLDAVQLTDDATLALAGSFRWAFDDAHVSYIAQRWDTDIGEVIETGIYEVSVTFDAGRPMATSNPQLIVPGEILEERALSGNHASMRTHDVSPDGLDLVYSDARGGLFLVDLVAPQISLLVAPELGGPREPAWSPDGTRIAFETANGDSQNPTYSIETIQPNGASRKVLASTKGSKGAFQVWRDVSHPRWSPTGSELIYKFLEWKEDQKGNIQVTVDIYRIPAGGGSKLNLTADTPESAIPAWWR